MSTQKQKEYQKQWRLNNPNYNKAYYAKRYKKVLKKRLNELTPVLEDTNVKWEYIEDSSYMISTSGTVINTITNKILKASEHSHGYLYLNLVINDEQKLHYVHRLVAKAFLANRYDKPEVNHIDGDKQNNNYINLEWSTRSENIQHAFDYLGRESNLTNWYQRTRS